MKLYIAINGKWHIVRRNRSSCAGFNLSDSNIDDYIFNGQNYQLQEIPLHLENICYLCYAKHRSYINKKIIEFKLGIKQ